ncbi:uncharacterized protein LOC100744224 isoform X1 [Bombus impatiens]|uniref:Uncharacterized protein LOC100744224 isoform X1 n=2 Tax=Bombus impatiens TaxID=132113 RepID=A0A6P3DW48_BOMIM|nr:uncharacterized protein LOC100744224 isoform X1 [Bombus impatiens]
MGNSHNKNVSAKRTTKVPYVKLPAPFMTEEEFFKNWNTWKNNFLAFKRVQNKNNSDKQQWGNLLLNLMGPVGQDIHNTFVFNFPNDKENVNILIEKFDEYYIFSGRKKIPLENVYKYIDDLQLIIKEKNIENEEELIKKKILTEINEHQFTNAAKQLIPIFIFSSDFNKLTLKEIAFIWKLYTDIISCLCCGDNHYSEKCPALGKQCVKCNKWNHFPRRCPTIFIYNCNYCGGDHMRKRCPAFNEICTKCQKLNHFKWKCHLVQIAQCRFCGLSHAASRSLCPAKDNVCSICKHIGHVPSKCNKKFYTHKH